MPAAVEHCTGSSLLLDTVITGVSQFLWQDKLCQFFSKVCKSSTIGQKGSERGYILEDVLINGCQFVQVFYPTLIISILPICSIIMSLLRSSEIRLLV
jgi:hypothetical protein